jgi:predicted transcriptional regulator
MTNEPTDDHAHDVFIPESDEADYPDTLRITALPAEKAQADSLDRIARWENGEEVPHVVNFEDPAHLRSLLTNRRMELLESVMEKPPESIRALADRLDRDVHDVHDDLHLLADYGIVQFRDRGRAKQPYVPYETVRLEVEFGSRRRSRSGTSASA